jgi:hypothetical protein
MDDPIEVWEDRERVMILLLWSGENFRTQLLLYIRVHCENFEQPVHRGGCGVRRGEDNRSVDSSTVSLYF